MSDAKTDANTTHSPGLPGVPTMWAAFAQLGAVVLLGAMFWQSQQAWFAQVKEDRQLVQKELDRVHSNMERTWQALRDQQHTIEQLSRNVADNQSSGRDLATAIKDLTSEVKRILPAVKP